MRALAALGLLVLSVAACEDQTIPPQTPPPPPPPSATVAPPPAPPADPPPIVEGDVTQATVDGAMVLVKRVPGAEMAAAQIYVKGGARDWTSADAGIGDLATRVATQGGTAKLDKDAFARKLADLGSTIAGTAGYDSIVFTSKGLLSQFEATTDLLFDTFLTPALPAQEVEIQRAEMLQTLAHEQENPDARLNLMVHDALFSGGHPYANRPMGTLDSVQKLSRDALNTYLGKERETSRLLVVVVGDLDASKVIAQVKARLDGVPRGSYQDQPLPPVAFQTASLKVTEADLPTNYIESAFVGPNWHDEGFYAGMVAMEHLAFRLFEEVRTKRNLSYAPGAHFRTATSVPYGYLYVTAVDPKATMEVMYAEAKKLRDAPLDDKALLAAKSTLLTFHLMSGETTDGLADDLADAQIHGGDWRLQRTLMEKVKGVSSADVQSFAKRYLQHMQVEVLGDPKKLDKSQLTSL